MSLLLENHFKRGEALTSPDMTMSYLISKLAGFEREVFSCLHLDNQHAVIAYEELFYGMIDRSREVLKLCLKYNTVADIFAHNHSEPSQVDLSIMASLKKALGIIDIRVLDHIIVGGSNTYSLAEKGLL